MPPSVPTSHRFAGFPSTKACSRWIARIVGGHGPAHGTHPLSKSQGADLLGLAARRATHIECITHPEMRQECGQASGASRGTRTAQTEPIEHRG